MKSIVYLLAAVLFTSCCRTPISYSETEEIKQKGRNERKVIYTGEMRLTVKEPDSVSAALLKLSERYNGYMVTAGTGYAEIRIPATSMQKVISEIGKLGKVSDKVIHGRDVTEEYRDDSLRLDNLLKSRDKYLSLLDKSVSVQDALQVEKELERVNTEIEILKGRMNKTDHLVENCTLRINIAKKVIPGPLGYVAIGAYKLIKILFVIS